MRCTNYKPYMIKFVSCWGMFIVWVAMFPQTIKLMLYNYALCIMYHVLFVICIYIPISCIAFGIKYYYMILPIYHWNEDVLDQGPN
jgi:hypothetical protein